MKTLDTRYLSALINYIKFLPIIIHVIMIMNILELAFKGLNITNFFYPILGHSVAYNILLLLLSIVFRFCYWHRALIYSMLINISIEWLCVNFHIDILINNIVVILSLITTIYTLISAVSFYKTGVMDPNSAFCEYLK